MTKVQSDLYAVTGDVKDINMQLVSIERLRSLEAERDALKAANAELVEALDELVDIVHSVLDNKPSVGSLIDSFTPQPARAALAKHKGLT